MFTDELKKIMNKPVFDISASDMRRFAELTNEPFIISYLDTYLSGSPNSPHLFQVYQAIIYQLVKQKHEAFDACVEMVNKYFIHKDFKQGDCLL